jgi:putative endonuclease
MGCPMHFVYVLQSLVNGRFYIGQTDNLLVRFGQHRQGLCRSTKGYRPWWMPYYEKLPTRTDAIVRERDLKRMKSAQSIRQTIKYGYACLGLSGPQLL